jgi:DNA-directed RNA polymerase specialized sigma24 family protein
MAVRLIDAEIPYRYARVRNKDRADDLVQDALLRGLEKRRLCRSVLFGRE